MANPHHKRDWSAELEHHIATDWADFRKYAPKKKIEMEDAQYRMAEGPFCGQPIDDVPSWYIDSLLCGGENDLVARDQALAAALARLGHQKREVPKTSTDPSTALGELARNAPDKEFLLDYKGAREAAAKGPGLQLESDVDRGRAHDAEMKRKLLGFRNNAGEAPDHNTQAQ